MISEARVCGKTYVVSFVERTDPNDVTCGLTKHLTQEVHVKQGMGPDQERDTVLHEFIHCIDETMGLGLKERQVHALAGGIYQLFMDNPGLLDYMFGGTVVEKPMAKTGKGTVHKKRGGK